MSDSMTEFQSILRSSKNIILLSGAGLSAASGIGTFRGAGGLWRKFDAMSLATPEAFAENPVRGWKFYHYRREAARKAEPNAAHYAMSKLAFESLRSTVAPNAQVSIITQNVDGLLPRALDTTAAKLKNSTETQATLIEMHGRLFDVICTQDKCDWSEFNVESPICEALRGTEDLVGDDLSDAEISLSDLPRCGKCGALARPGVVWFGESIPTLNQIDKLVRKADLCLVVGTSSTVYPAAGFASRVRRKGGTIAVFNIESTPGDKQANYVFIGPCEETLPKALGLALRKR